MTERLPRDAIDRENRLDRQDLEAGMTVVIEWSPYGWAIDNEDYVGRHYVRITDVSDLVGDVRSVTPDGRPLKDYGEGRAQVGGRADNTADVPDFTDVGRGARYYQTDEELDK